MKRDVNYTYSNRYFFDIVVCHDDKVRLIRSMRSKKDGWFVFDERRCRRYYNAKAIRFAMRDYLQCLRWDLQNLRD
jgi:hypothetical protein